MKKTTAIFWISIVIAIVFIIWGVVPESLLPRYNLKAVSSAVHSFLIDKFGWFYLLSASLFLAFCLFLIFSRYGNIRLGRAEKNRNTAI